jgi:two-component system response regulator
MKCTETRCEQAVILLAEDDSGDQVLTCEAFKGFRFPYDLRMVADGKEALDYLYKQGDYASAAAPQPDLILLDLNMPRVNGQQVAERIHADAHLSNIPIVVLTTSRRQEDVVRLYGQGVTSFISKPMDFQGFAASLQDLEHLIKFLLKTKSLRERARPTDRQLTRLARRREQFKIYAERLFDKHMTQIETIFAENPQVIPKPREGADAGPVPVEMAARQALLALAGKILQSHVDAGKPWAGRTGAEPAKRTDETCWKEPFNTWRGLSALAQRLDSLAEDKHPQVLHSAVAFNRVCEPD